MWTDLWWHSRSWFECTGPDLDETARVDSPERGGARVERWTVLRTWGQRTDLAYGVLYCDQYWTSSCENVAWHINYSNALWLCNSERLVLNELMHITWICSASIGANDLSHSNLFPEWMKTTWGSESVACRNLMHVCDSIKCMASIIIRSKLASEIT